VLLLLLLLLVLLLLRMEPRLVFALRPLLVLERHVHQRRLLLLAPLLLLGLVGLLDEALQLKPAVFVLFGFEARAGQRHGRHGLLASGRHGHAGALLWLCRRSRRVAKESVVLAVTVAVVSMMQGRGGGQLLGRDMHLVLRQVPRVVVFVRHNVLILVVVLLLLCALALAAAHFDCAGEGPRARPSDLI